MYKFGKVDLGSFIWVRERVRRGYQRTKTYYAVYGYDGEEKNAIYVICDGFKGRGKWYVKFQGKLSILNEIQNPMSVYTYYDTSRKARAAAKALIIKMESLKAFI